MSLENDTIAREAPHPDGVPLGKLLRHDDGHYSSIHCPACGRGLRITFAALVEKFGQDIGAVALTRRIRCQGCGRRGLLGTLCWRHQGVEYEILDRWSDGGVSEGEG